MSATNQENSVKKIYQTVIEEVIQNVREQFLDEGYDDQFLQELKQLWESKLNASRAVNLENNDATLSARLPVHQKDKEDNSNKHRQSTVGASAAAATSVKHEALINTVESATLAAVNALPTNLVPNVSNTFFQKQQQQQVQTATLPIHTKSIVNSQLDGLDDDSSDDDDVDADDPVLSPGNFGHAVGGDEDEEDLDDDDDEDKHGDEAKYDGKEDPDPLNSSDDVSEMDSNETFETDNVIVCQYDKITRIKNHWKFHLKDGIMNINGRDYLFSKATGDADW